MDADYNYESEEEVDYSKMDMVRWQLILDCLMSFNLARKHFPIFKHPKT